MTKETGKLSNKDLQKKLKELSNDWKMDNQKLSLNLKLDSFKEVIDLTNEIALIAEELNHHPNLKIHSYNQLNIQIYTHDVEGITEKDFLLAHRIDQLNL